MADTDKLKSLGDDHVRSLKMTARPDALREMERARNELLRNLLDNAKAGTPGAVTIQSQSGCQFTDAETAHRHASIHGGAVMTDGYGNTRWVSPQEMLKPPEPSGNAIMQRAQAVDCSSGYVSDGIGWVTADLSPRTFVLPVLHSEADLKAAIEGATIAEHARIMAAIEKCRPTDQPYTRRDWALEERGKRELWDKIMKALGEGAK